MSKPSACMCTCVALCFASSCSSSSLCTNFSFVACYWLLSQHMMTDRPDKCSNALCRAAWLCFASRGALLCDQLYAIVLVRCNSQNSAPHYCMGSLRHHIDHCIELCVNSWKWLMWLPHSTRQCMPTARCYMYKLYGYKHVAGHCSDRLV